MESKTEKSQKKFSFRKRKSSKGKKDIEQQPVDNETEQQVMSATAQNCDETPEKASGVDQQKQFQTPPLEQAESSGEDPNPKSTSESARENAGKKKSKRRSLFKRSSKKSSVDESCELQVKSNESTDNKSEDEKDETSTVDNATSSVEDEQVVCEEQAKSAEITAEQSDVEGYLSVGDISEAEGETLLEGTQESSPESAIIQPDKGTKRKGFFKRGLSLKRRKSKKQTNERKDESATVKESCESQTDKNKEAENREIVTEANDFTKENEETSPENHKDTEDNESKPEKDKTSISTVQKDPVKLTRKVSFVGPDGAKLDSSDDGDSPAEEIGSTGDESDGDTITGEDGPSEVSEKVPEEVAPEVVIMIENAGCSEPFTEGEKNKLLKHVKFIN